MQPIEENLMGLASFARAYDDLLARRPGMLASESGGELNWMHRARERDAARWRRDGFPKRSNERWRYTNLDDLSKASVVLAKPGPRPPRNAFPHLAPPDRCYEIVFFNGDFVPEWSTLPAPGKGVSVEVLSRLLNDCVNHGWSSERRARLGAFQAHVESSDADRETVFAAMNTSFMQDGVLIHVAPESELDYPIVVSYFSDPSSRSEDLEFSSPRVFAHVEAGGSAAVIEFYSGKNGRPYFTNSVVDIRLEPRARLSHCRVQSEGDHGFHISTTRIRQKRDSFAETFQFSFGSKLARNDLHIGLEEHGAEVALDGLYMVRDRQHVDNYTLVEHIAENTVSRQVYKGVLDGASRAVFNGHVRIRRNAQKSDAQQLNQNLLLSEHAEADTRPELEIDADDVKATHGATVGQIDPEHVFYLKARAIGEDQAISMLSRGYAQDVVFRIQHDAVRGILRRTVDEKFDSFRKGGRP